MFGQATSRTGKGLRLASAFTDKSAVKTAILNSEMFGIRKALNAISNRGIHWQQLTWQTWEPSTASHLYTKDMERKMAAREAALRKIEELRAQLVSCPNNQKGFLGEKLARAQNAPDALDITLPMYRVENNLFFIWQCWQSVRFRNSVAGPSISTCLSWISTSTPILFEP